MNKLAQTIPDLKEAFSSNPALQFKTLGDVLTSLLNIGFMISAFLTFYFLLWGAWQYIFAGGEKEALAKAREKIKWALIGLLFVAGSFTMTTYAGQVFPSRWGLPF